MTQSQLRHCDFCDEYVPRDEPLGTATAYISYLDDREGGKEHARVCADCALADVPRPDESFVATCDICGHAGYTTSGRTGYGSNGDPVYRNATVMSWRVSVAGLKGPMHACIECTPIQNRDMRKERPKRRTIDYGETE